MSTAGPNAGSNANTFSGTDAWSTPSNALAQDGVFSAVTRSASSVQKLGLWGFGFALPNSTVNGIQADIKCKTSTGTATLQCYLFQDISVGGSGLIGAGQNFTPSTTNAIVTIGGASFLWGAGSISYSDVNLSTFGPWIDPTLTASGVVSSVDYVQLTVTYTVAATGFKNLPLLGVGLVNTLIHGLTLGLCSWRWRPFTRTQTRTAGVSSGWWRS